jgi:uncharacterized membrane protein
MTKIYYLSKNNLTGEYSMHSGVYGSRREDLGRDPDYLIKEVKKRVDRKRKTDFFIIKENFPESSLKNIRKYFSDSKVKISLSN